MQVFPVIDGHNDLLLRLHTAPEKRESIWLRGEGAGHLDLPRMRKGGFAGGFFAIYVPSPDQGFDMDALTDKPPYDIALPAPVDINAARSVAVDMAGHLLWMERASKGAFRICRTAGEVRSSMQDDVIFAIMHLEGAEPIDEDLDGLHVLHALGLRSLGPVWSRPNRFGEGVPFAFPSGPDRGDGLTSAGRDLIAQCNALRVMIDLSHLNEAGFNDVARLSRAPLVATHSNAHAVSASSRNLTDRQLDIIRDSDGMVGLNFATCFLRPDGRSSPEMDFKPIFQHLDHLIDRLGEGRVGLGSDFDGATMPQVLSDVSALPDLQRAMAQHGYDDALRRKICNENWLRVLTATLEA